MKSHKQHTATFWRRCFVNRNEHLRNGGRGIVAVVVRVTARRTIRFRRRSTILHRLLPRVDHRRFVPQQPLRVMLLVPYVDRWCLHV